MNLVFVTAMQFRTIWAKLQPQERFLCDLGQNSLKLIGTNTIIMTREGINFGTLEGLEEVTLAAVLGAVTSGEFERLVLVNPEDSSAAAFGM